MKFKAIGVIAGLALCLAACNEKTEANGNVNVSAQAAPAKAVKDPNPNPRADVKHDFETIDWAKAKEYASQGAVFVDVRNPEELREGYVPNAVNIPLGQMKDRYVELSSDKVILVYCRSGRRSQIAAQMLHNKGFKQVYNVAGGFMNYPKD
ncbi:MAG: rhodanese-like domain-containing protein [Fibrobacter sp.]|nr:rhodanese-like domain-containing protein [Fibrobacter sp.]